MRSSNGRDLVYMKLCYIPKITGAQAFIYGYVLVFKGTIISIKSSKCSISMAEMPSKEGMIANILESLKKTYFVIKMFQLIYQKLFKGKRSC